MTPRLVGKPVPLLSHGLECVHVFEASLLAKILEPSVEIISIRRAKLVPILFQPQVQRVIEDRNRFDVKERR